MRAHEIERLLVIASVVLVNQKLRLQQRVRNGRRNGMMDQVGVRRDWRVCHGCLDIGRAHGPWDRV